jgi:hypothetical protein
MTTHCGTPVVSPQPETPDGERPKLPPAIAAELRRLWKEILVAAYHADQQALSTSTVTRPSGRNREGGTPNGAV